MAFDNRYHFFRKNEWEYNVLPLFGFLATSKGRTSVENIGSKTTATYQGNGKYEISTSAPNLYFKTVGYDFTYERDEKPTGRALELEEKFEQILKNKGKSIDETEYVARNVKDFYAKGNRPTPPFKNESSKFVVGGIIASICMIIAVILVGIVFGDKIVEMLPDFVQKMGIQGMQAAYPIYAIIFGIGALCFYTAFKKNNEYKARLEEFKQRPMSELSASEIEELKKKHISMASFSYWEDEELKKIVVEMIEINNKECGY